MTSVAFSADPHHEQVQRRVIFCNGCGDLKRANLLRAFLMLSHPEEWARDESLI